MKAPLSWLREYVAIELPPVELASRLALTGTEVERVSHSGVPPQEDLEKLFVVGKVLSCEAHPNADKLSVCRVNTGEEEARTIVCGAPNVAAGQTVAVVLPGAVLPGGLKIGEAKLRGVRSAGMILSAAELEFEPKSAGIMELPDEWPAGAPLVEYLPVFDYVLEVEVTPNRPDCLSIKGLAREVAAITERPFPEEQSFDFPVGERQAEEDISIEVRDPDLCPRYAARVIRGVRVEESPPWLKARITQVGMRPVNNVVDVTNYVMWALGQPLHAFDLATIADAKIIVRRAKEGELITTLDGQERSLSAETLVIADAEKPSVIAGIMGSQDSEVTESTTDLLLEAANFSRAGILRTESALSLRTESSTRFEKGLDPNLVTGALDMASALITELCGGTVSQGTVDVKAGSVEPWELELRDARLRQILGIDVPSERTVQILQSLGCLAERADGRTKVTVPTFRRDLEREIDLVEEVIRIYGLDRLPLTQPARPAGGGGLTAEQAAVRRVQDLLAGAGLSQAITYSFIDPEWLSRLGLPADDFRQKTVTLRNPLSREQSVMRTMLLPGLLATAARNRAVREEQVHLFENGVTFHPREHPERVTGDVRDARRPEEVNRLGVLLMGPVAAESWLVEEELPDFYSVKGLVERLLYGLNVRDAEFGETREPFLHPGKAAVLSVAGEAVGWLGEVHPLVLRSFDLPEGVVAAELSLDGLLTGALELPVYEDLLTFPAVEQDLALVVERDTPAAEVVRAVRTAGGALLHAVSVFDLYEGPQVGPGKKSLALRLTFRSKERTLHEDEVNALREAMVAELKSALGAELRT